MRVTTENSQIRRKSNSSAIYLHIPYLNYLFFFFQARGAYIAIKDYYHINREIPGIARTLVLSLKFSFFGTFYATILQAILLIFGVTPFGHMAAYYIGLKGDFWAGLYSPATSAYLFGELPAVLHQTELNSTVLLTSAALMFLTYVIYGLVGAYLARYNLKSDIRRNLIPVRV